MCLGNSVKWVQQCMFGLQLLVYALMGSYIVCAERLSVPTKAHTTTHMTYRMAN